MFNEDTILSFIKNYGSPIDYFTIVRSLKIRSENNHNFTAFLNQLVAEHKIFKNRKDLFYIPEFVGEYQGILKINFNGFGFIDIEQDENNKNQTENESIYIGKNDLNTAFNNDKVLVKKFKNFENNKENYFGVITQVLERNTQFLIGKIEKMKDMKIFQSLNTIYKNFYKIIKNQTEHNLEINDVVKAEIINYGKRFIEINIVKYIGKYNDAFVDIETEISSFNISTEFPVEVIKSANKIPQTIENDPSLSSRIDLRNEMIYTIDGDDTKDFDDAISVKKMDNGNYLLGVHIADVTNYVIENSEIDKEALKRGTSIYLVDRVIPMLPESLSNGICSLNPHVDRLTLTLECEVDKKGNNVSSKIYPSIINSKKRLTYHEVNQFFKNEINFSKEIDDSLKVAYELAQIIRNNKNEQGYVDFEIEEPKIILDEKGKPTNIKIKKRGESEVLIEDFMVRANETVSEIMTNKEIPFIYRIHEKPDPEKLDSLERVLKILDVNNINIPLGVEPKEFAEIISLIKEQKFDNMIKILLLKTMQKAVYSSKNIGHFGLASKAYSHFTSPIRRYPDLIAHRIIREILFNKNYDLQKHFQTILEEVALANSHSEQKAVELERKVADIKKAELYEEKVGKIYKGQIVSTLKFGFFVEFSDDMVSVLVRKNNIDPKSNQQLELSEDGFSLKNSARNFRIGDYIDVMIIKSDKSAGKIDGIIANDLIWYQNQQKEFENNKFKYKNRK